LRWLVHYHCPFCKEPRMTTTDLLDRSLGDLARSIPGATAMFHRLQLDFCCGGKKTLRDAAAPLQLDADALAEELAGLQQLTDVRARDWRQATAPELIDHILTRYHERHRVDLPELARLARRVETVHADRPECPHGLADHLEAMYQELLAHMEKEEQVLFPLLSHGMSPLDLPPVDVMRIEHDDHGRALARMVQLAHGLQTPAGACNTWRALLAGLRALREDLMQHIHLENNVLFEGLNRAEAGNGGCGGSGGCRCAAEAAR
jgi:regulator of cell morphogenesis and NO signaling